MKRINSVGGYRVYPSSPGQSDANARWDAIIGQFNDGLDRLQREKTLSDYQQQIIDDLQSGSRLAVTYVDLTRHSSALWRSALQHQQELNRGVCSGPFATHQLGHHLIECAERWSAFKRKLGEST